uniref:Cysteine-rich transmembrane CYSTM domain-containing protein n=1 Tax=Kalanchoe fedtschenkoi TaxID=63787 RepID=A0A7N0TB82_KALFE
MNSVLHHRQVIIMIAYPHRRSSLSRLPHISSSDEIVGPPPLCPLPHHSYPGGYPPPPPPPYQSYQAYFNPQGYAYPPPPQQYQCCHVDYCHDDRSGCLSFFQGCLAALCCCCMLEECCFF